MSEPARKIRSAVAALAILGLSAPAMAGDRDRDICYLMNSVNGWAGGGFRGGPVPCDLDNYNDPATLLKWRRDGLAIQRGQDAESLAKAKSQLESDDAELRKIDKAIATLRGQ